MEIRDVSEELRSLAMECMEMGSMERPEVTWRTAGWRTESSGRKENGYFEDPVLENRLASSGQP